MGTPLRIDHIGQLAAAPLFRALEFAHDPDAISAKDLQQARPTLRVPATSIYSRTDGLAPWQLCQEGQGPMREAIEVVGSHCGLAHNPAVLAIVANRLALPEDDWSPFIHSRLSRFLGTRAMA